VIADHRVPLAVVLARAAEGDLWNITQ
jgi:hypothetical protein